jgi:adenylate kinase
MARGELVPDDVVIAIVSARIDEPDARNGFILDGFPRTVPQAHALDRLLAQKGLKLDAVIELKVDEGILLDRIEKRIAQMQARGEALRPDDNADVLRRRLLAYRDQTAPLIAYYQLQSVLRSVDGMASVEEVGRAIEGALRGPKKTAPGKAPGEARSGQPQTGKARAASALARTPPKPGSKSGKSDASRRGARKSASGKSGRGRRLTKRN